MNNSTGKTRFICRVVRFQTALFDRDPAASGHSANCAECQTYFRASGDVVSHLRHTATKEMQNPPDELAARIASAVRQAKPAPARSRSRFALSAFAGAAAAAAVTLFVVRVNWPATHDSATRPPTVEMSPSEVAGLVSDVDQLRVRFMNSVEPAATKLASQNPLTQELKSVQADARSALGFLAINFLPSGSAQAHDPESNSTRG